jgi:tetratricopeptide (TPR) repeat protein
MVADLYARIPQCRVVVMTLGLAEAWFDTLTGYYLNGAPHQLAMAAAPKRFRLDVLTVDEINDCLARIYDLLERYGHPDFRLLLTVSPVPFRATFTGQDAITANTYSKSALRAAAEAFVIGHPRAEYFPSYEIVTHTIRSSAYIQDNRHVTPQVVQTIADRVVDAYCPEPAGSGEQEVLGPRVAVVEIQKATKEGDFARVAKLYATLDGARRFRKAGYDEFSFRFDYGRALLRTGAVAEAQAQLARAVQIDPNVAAAVHQLARALARLQRPLEAEETFRRACELAPDSPAFRLAWANQLMELGAYDDAEREMLTVSAQHPSDPRPEEALAQLRERMETKPMPQPQLYRQASQA